MSYLRIKADILRPDLGKFTADLHKQSGRIWREAISVYIQAVANVVSLHQETGMSYASLFPAARDFVRSKGALPPLSPKISMKKTRMNMTGTPIRGAYKTAAMGKRAGEKCVTATYGGVGRPILTFNFEIRVYQYLMNELGEFSISALESMEAGRQAMAEYLDNYGHLMFPDFNKYFTPLLIG